MVSVSVGAQKSPYKSLAPEDRLAILRRSQVWTPTDVSKIDIKAGPQGKGSFSPGETVTCEYVNRSATGNSPKFMCAITHEDEVKVKYGADNGETFAEVAATRLLWALGFGADRMYPVRLICRGCPDHLGGVKRGMTNVSIFEYASIERKAPGQELETRPDEGWSWSELDLVEETVGGAPPAHRDALKLLAVMLQHTDSKPAQQRLSCLDVDHAAAKNRSENHRDGDDRAAGERPPKGAEMCLHPFMLINDLGLTFGGVDSFNRDSFSSVNYDRWSATPVWKKPTNCIGNLSKSLTGSLYDPVISEEGRAFLAGLLAQLSDAQLTDLFTVARFPDRILVRPHDERHAASVEEWVQAFKQKRNEIASRSCPS
jgi:hypothetical protein